MYNVYKFLKARNVILVLFGVVLLFSAVGMSLAHAQGTDEITLSISPPAIEISLNPGDSSSNNFRLSNNSNEAINIETTPRNFLPRGIDGAIEIVEDDTPFSLAEWITVSPTSSVTIGPQSFNDFTVTIDVPDNAHPGGHFGSVVFKTIPGEADDAGALISQEIAPVILVKIPGDVDESGFISTFQSTKNIWSNQDSIDFDLVVENIGNVHYRPSGQLVIRNIIGQEVHRSTIDGQNVIPGAQRRLDANWKDVGFRMGYYQAEVTLVYGSDSQILDATSSFFIVPYQVLLPISVIVLIVLFFLFKGRRRIKRAIKALSATEES